jgi:phosphocarrier protein HPr
MNGEPLRSTVILRNSQGFHMRPIGGFVELASKFQSDVLVSRAGQEKVNGKSMMNMLAGMLAESGTELTLEVHGPDAPQALEALVKFFDELVISEP